MKVRSVGELIEQVTDILTNCGGATYYFALKKRVGGHDHEFREFCETYFKIKKGGANSDKVCLAPTTQRKRQELDHSAEKVLRLLVKMGGSGDLHDLTRRTGVPKKHLLRFAKGGIFREEDGQLHLVGGAGKVAKTAAAVGAVTIRSGRRRSSKELLTSTGASTNWEAEAHLVKRIEGLVTSEGDGSLHTSRIYDSLALLPCSRLRRWFPRVGMQVGPSGELTIDETRLAYYRIRRAVRIMSLLASNGGEMPLASVINFIRRPPELVELEKKEAEAPMLPAPPRVEAEAAPVLPAPVEDDGGSGAEKEDETSLATAIGSTAMVVLSKALAMSNTDIMKATEPFWIESWLRENFPVLGGMVQLPADPLASRPIIVRHPDAPPEMTADEEFAMLMRIDEELHLSYGRMSQAVVKSCFRVKKRFLKRFYDFSADGEILRKSVARQIREAIGISRCVIVSGGSYTVTDAFTDFGARRKWLEALFTVDEDGSLRFDADDSRAWDPPPPEPRAPSPFSYNVMDVPKEYMRKRRRRYLRREYVRGAGGRYYTD